MWLARRATFLHVCNVYKILTDQLFDVILGMDLNRMYYLPVKLFDVPELWVESDTPDSCTAPITDEMTSSTLMSFRHLPNKKGRQWRACTAGCHAIVSSAKLCRSSHLFLKDVVT